MPSDSTSSACSHPKLPCKVSPSTSEAAYADSATSATNGSASSSSPSSESLLVSELGESLAEPIGPLPPIVGMITDADGERVMVQDTPSGEHEATFAGWQLANYGAMPLRLKVPAAPAASEKEAAERMRALGSLAQQLFKELTKWRTRTRRLSRARPERPIARPRKRRCSACETGPPWRGSNERAPR